MTSIGVGRYVCLQTPGWLGAIIRWSTHSRYNHALIAGPGGLCAEATPRGVRITNLSRYSRHLACANLGEPMTAQQGAQVWAAAEAMAGAPYNFPDLLAIGLGDLGWHWKALIWLAGNDHAFICSQMVALAGKAAGLDWMCRDTSADQVTPAALALRKGVVPVTITG